MKQIVALIFATVVGIALAYQPTPVLNVYASKSSPYDSGYDHGCDDAGRSESDKYINQREKGPSFHTGEFMDGYYAGLNACGGGASGGGGGDSQGQAQGQGQGQGQSQSQSQGGQRQCILNIGPC